MCARKSSLFSHRHHFTEETMLESNPADLRSGSELYRQTKRRVAKKLKDGYVLTADGASERQS